jgi:hypothetical protein
LNHREHRGEERSRDLFFSLCSLWFFNFYQRRFLLKRLCGFLIGVAALQADPLPSCLSVATGVFDILRDKYRTWEFEIEYKTYFPWKPNPHVNLRPLVGLMATVEGSVYVYGGLNFDLLFFDHLLFAPGFAAGYYHEGGGKNLGYPAEFRSGIELAWQFNDYRRLGIHFYHLSNASLGRRNPGEESLVLFYDIPLVKGFPFNYK